MLDSLIRLSLKHRLFVLLLAVLLLGAGTYTVVRMPVDVFPDLTAPTVTILVESHGMAPTEVESQVTFPIEAALNGAPGVRRVRSSSSVGLAVVWVEFEWGMEIREARQVVTEKLAVVANELPPEVDPPVLAPVSSMMGEIMFVALTSSRHSGMELRTTAESIVRRRLLAVPGVSQVTPMGGEVRQYQVVADPLRLVARGVTLDQLLEALNGANENVSAGFLVQSSTEYLVTGHGRVRSLADISNTVIFATNRVPVLVGDVAAVQFGAEPKRGEASANGEPAVLLGIQKQPGANTLELTERLDAVLKDLAATLPEGMRVNKNLFRQADFISVAIQNVEHALRDGAILVVLIVFIFLLNGRATFITLTAIPLSLVSAVLILKAFGGTINTMTLGGMAIAIGALVDDAVIDVDNVFRRLRENSTLPADKRRPAFEVVLNASIEIRSSIFFATLIIVLVFLPIFFLSGVEGRLLKPLGVAYVVALLASLLVAVTVTPVLCYLLLPRSKGVQSGHEPRTVGKLKRGYAPLLRKVIEKPGLAVVPAVLLLVAALVSLSFAGRSFLPEFNEGSLTISAVTLPGTPLADSDKLAKMMEESLLAHPEVESTARRTGRAELDEHALGVETSEVEVRLKMRERTREELLEAIRKDLSQIPGIVVSIGQPISHRIDHMLSGTRANIAIKIFGEDLAKLRQLGEKVREAIEGVPGAVDVFLEQQMEIPTLRVDFDRNAMANYGVPIDEAGKYLEAALQGVRVSRVLEGRNSYDLVLRIGIDGPLRAETLNDLQIGTPSGTRVALSEIAKIQKETGPNTISREQVERKIVVSCNVAGRDLSSVVEDCRRAVDPIIDQETNFRVEYGGQFESAEQANRILILLGVAVLAGILILLRTAFNSMRDAALVMVNLPLALIGGVAGVFLSGGVLSIASLVGFITLFGIATRNGIMLVAHIRHLQREEGVTNFREAVERGAMERLAPILMTGLAAGLALVPLALGGGEPGNEIQTPMAIVILCGLISSMVLNMLIVPALYLRFSTPLKKEGIA